MDLKFDDLLLCEFSEDGDGPHYYNCWNLCREVYRRAGRLLPKYGDYICDLSARAEKMKKIGLEQFAELPAPEFLALVPLRLEADGITHVGCVINKRKFIHISLSGVSITDIKDRKWRNKIIGFYRYAPDNSSC